MVALTILSLFGRTPFAHLLAHMECVFKCVHCLPSLCQFLEEKNVGDLEQLTDQIFHFEHEADLIKNDIRKNLSNNLYLLDRSQLLEILSLQDAIADHVEDAAVLTTLKPLELLLPFKESFKLFLQKNIETFDQVYAIIKELPELIEASFGGKEAEKVRSMVEDVGYREHEVDLIQRQLLRNLFEAENQLSYATFYQWQRLFIAIGSISNLSENLANRVRMTLELT